MRSSTLARFRQMSKFEEQLIRAAMPRTSARNPEPLPLHGAPADGQPFAQRRVRLVARPLTFKLSEVR